MNDAIKDFINTTIKNNDVVLFMKGNAEMPKCGFSNVVCKILEHFQINFQDINVLEDNEIRQGIKDYSDWPTIPQLYIKGEFIGGCDIVRDMYDSGELKTLLEKHQLIKKKEHA